MNGSLLHVKKRISKFSLTALSIWALAATIPADLPAQSAVACPPLNAPGPNLLQNPDLETVGPCGTFTWWQMGVGSCLGNVTASAAQGWTTHSSNQGALIKTTLLQSALPLGGLTKMLHVVTAGNEGGVFQQAPAGLTKIMVSAWVYVRTGHVLLLANANNTGPVSWNSKFNEWELLRVCTDGTVPINLISVVNEDVAGSDYFLDRLELRVIN